MNFLHLFIPHEKNNHRSKILHHASLLIIIFVFAALTFAGVLLNKNYPDVLGISYQISNEELLNLVNYERAQEGLEELSLNEQLSKAAAEKAENMFENNYWAHFSPDGTTPWSFIKGNNYDYLYAGENLAKGYTSSYEAVKAWMNSPSHRANIMSPKYKDMGFAIAEGQLQGEDTVLIVQMFGSTYQESSQSNLAKDVELQPVAINELPASNNALGSESPNNIKTNDTFRVNPLIDVIFGTKAIVFSILSVLIISLVLDFIIVEKNKIPRVVGNNLDHIILIILFMVYIFTLRIGEII